MLTPPRLRAALGVWKSDGVYACVCEPGVANELCAQHRPATVIFQTAMLYMLPLRPYEEYVVVLLAYILKT